MLIYIIQLHKELLLWMNSLIVTYPQYNTVIYFIAEKLDNYVILLSGLTLFYFVYQSIEYTSWKRFRYILAEGLQLVIAVSTAWGVSYFIKQITKIPRPFLRFPDEIVPLFDYGGIDSFPSGHATLFMALGVMTSLHHKRAGYVFIFFALIISLARVIGGVHSPIDIIAGWLIGSGISLFIYKKFFSNK